MRMSRAIFLSVLVGFACLLLPVQSTDGRLYGTYGNPTSFGYAVFLAFALSAAFRSASESIFFASLLGLMFVVTGSISVLLAAESSSFSSRHWKYSANGKYSVIGR